MNEATECLNVCCMNVSYECFIILKDNKHIKDKKIRKSQSLFPGVKVKKGVADDYDDDELEPVEPITSPM